MGANRKTYWSRGRIVRAPVLAAMLALAAVVTMASGITASAQGSLDQEVSRLAERILGQAPALTGKSLGSLWFVTTDGRLTELGVYVEDGLQVELSRRRHQHGFELVDRKLRPELLGELRFGLSDVADQSRVASLGQLLGAHFLVRGLITDRGPEIVISGTLIEVATGRSFPDRVTVRKDPEIVRLLSRTIPWSGPPEPPAKPAPPVPATDRLRAEIALDPGQASYRVGDPIRFRVRVSEEAYVVVVNYGVSGKTTVLFPNDYARDNRVRGGQWVEIPPGGEAGWQIRALGPPGTELVRVFATREPWRLPFTGGGGSGGAYRNLEPAEKGTLTRDLNAVKESARPGTWAEQMLQFEVR